jgi:hypothetical protein
MLPKQLVWWSNIDIHNSKEVPENFFITHVLGRLYLLAR